MPYITFVSRELIDSIRIRTDNITKDKIVKRLRRRNFSLRFSEIREVYASRAVKHLRQPEIDFLQGRVSSSVFMRNYFNPLWISDLRQRALVHAKELLDTLQ